MKRLIFWIVVSLFFGFLTTHAIAKDLKAIKLVYSNNSPAKAGGNIFFENVWIPKINGELAKVGYKLDFTNYHASSLYKAQDQVNACEKGLIDATVFIVGWEQARAPLHQILSLPMMGFSAHSSSNIWFDLQESVPEFGDEFSKYVELFHFSSSPGIFNMNKVRRTPEEFKGVKVYATGVMADFFKSIGASPLRIDAPDWYSSLDRGLIEMVPFGAFMVNFWKLYEVVDVHVIPAGGDALSWVCCSYIINKERFNRFPPEVQKIIKDNARWASTELTESEEKNRIKSENMFREIGHEVIFLTQEETELWRRTAAPTHENWINEMEAKGLPGRRLYNEAKRLIKVYK